MTKILVIENDRETREILLECLKLKGFEVISAENDLQGVKQAHIHLPDVIICDATLPELDSYGVLKTLRQNLNTAIIPLIFLTDKSSQQEMHQGMELGANDYLVKPFTPKELLGAIAASVK
ncbi:MAG: response regulator [Pleurocapsa minor HA4230-MV1]|jgi:DNA-binding response OmpR family regulator|nr:response regulator [Pleurocapsa minor HA4230-MV1]